MSRLIPGHCYVTHKDVSESRADWQQRIQEAIASGGWRRAETGETFIHNKDGRITAEIYANIPVPNQQE